MSYFCDRNIYSSLLYSMTVILIKSLVQLFLLTAKDTKMLLITFYLWITEPFIYLYNICSPIKDYRHTKICQKLTQRYISNGRCIYFLSYKEIHCPAYISNLHLYACNLFIYCLIFLES